MEWGGERGEGGGQVRESAGGGIKGRGREKEGEGIRWKLHLLSLTR